MNLQDYLQSVIVSERAKSFAKSDQLTLGEMILKLEPIVKMQDADPEREATVHYDFGMMFPTTIDSWRGSYSELALDYSEEGKPLTVSAFLDMLKNAVGATFTGYKGGEFTMNKNTPVRVTNYGRSGNTGVINIVDNEYQVIIMTGYCEY